MISELNYETQKNQEKLLFKILNKIYAKERISRIDILKKLILHL